MKKHQILFFLISPFLLFSCKEEVPEVVVESVYQSTYNHEDSCNNTEFTYDDFNIIELELNERAYADTITALELPALRDDNDILLHTYVDKLDYHPVSMATHAIALLDIYTRTKDETYLLRAVKHADKLLGISLQIDSVIFFPYSFNYKFYDRDMMQAPWYSAMAQGKTLSLFSRLYEITSDEKYLTIASKIYSTFSHLKATHDPWISCIDNDGSLWFEEYPFEEPSHVFNGMIFAIYGVYDYYMIHKTEEVSTVLKAVTTTIKKNMHLIRDENEVSYYCIKYTVRNPMYHPIHVKQLGILHKVSGFPEFKKMSDDFLNDWSTESDTK